LTGCQGSDRKEEIQWDDFVLWESAAKVLRIQGHFYIQPYLSKRLGRPIRSHALKEVT